MTLSRRDFVFSGAAAALGAGVDLSAAEGGGAPPNAEAEAKVAWILGKYGQRFTEQQKKELRDRIVGGQAGLETMRAFPLDNGVEPVTLFRVYRAPAKPQRKVVPHE